jgi:predicted ATPase/class 3 adenylate cyclase
VEFRILGRLEVVSDGRDRTPTRPKQRALLALLLLHANEVVASDTIIDTLWGRDPPETALTALHGHVSALRKLLGHDLIETRTPGYVLRLDSGQTDVERFERLLERARRELEPARRAALLREALELYRGDPLADFRYEAFAERELARLEELHATALEERIDAELAAGRHERQILNQDPELDLGEGVRTPGTMTFLFTDIEGSTVLLHMLGERYSEALDAHRRLLRHAFARHNGNEVDTQGDAFFVAFASARDAIAAALDAQRALASERWPEDVEFRVRIGIHTCEARPAQEGYVGLGVHRAARICAAGHGGQVLVSHTTRALLVEEPLEDVGFRDLGPHRLKDLSQAERIFQLVADGLRSEFPPLDTLDTRPTNLPTQGTPLIGREREVAQVRDRLRSAEFPILTLTGPGGTGKTRLALQAAADSLGHFPSGAFLVPLAPISDPELVLPTIAHVLGLRVPRGQALMRALTDYLAEHKPLLVLDNVEHVIAAAPAVARMAANAPGLKILASSREALHVSGERVFPVPALELPFPDDALDALAANEAVRLFVERAQAIRPDFELTEANGSAVAAICRALDGLPLAIELAAARVVLFPPAALLARLGQRLELLTGGARDRPERHQTLRATLDWSYDLLSESRRRLFARLGVFAGGWTLDAAEAVCGEGLDTLDGLGSLIDKSLVRLEGSDEQPRFAMLETIREYALEKLREAREEPELRERHLEWCLTFAERAEPELRGSEQATWLDRLHAELDNFRAAFDWSLSQDATEASLRLGSALVEFWIVRADWNEGRDWLERALRVPAEVEPAVRMKALRAAGELADVLSDYPSAVRYFEESLAIARSLGHRRGIADALLGLAHELDNRLGRHAEARPLLEEAVRICRELGDEPSLARSLGGIAWLEQDYRKARALWSETVAIRRRLGNRENVAWAVLQVGYCAQCEGDYEAAVAAYDECLSIGRELGYKRLIARSLTQLSEAALLRGDLAEARRLYEESIPMWRETGHRSGLVDALWGLGNVARLEGGVEEATACLEESLEVCREIGARSREAAALQSLGAFASARGEREEAVRLHREALSRWRDWDDAAGAATELWRVAALAALEGRHEIAARMLGASEALRERVGAAIPPCDARDYDQAVEATRAGLSEDELARAWAAGRELDLAAAADLALAAKALA